MSLCKKVTLMWFIQDIVCSFLFGGFLWYLFTNTTPLLFINNTPVFKACNICILCVRIVMCEKITFFQVENTNASYYRAHFFLLFDINEKKSVRVYFNDSCSMWKRASYALNISLWKSAHKQRNLWRMS